MRSDITRKGLRRGFHRSILYGLGHPPSDLTKPFVGVINSYAETIPGHMHLRTLATAVKEGIRSAGGVPFEVNTMALCDSPGMGLFPAANLSLPSREIIADSCELLADNNCFDAVVFLSTCDKIVPGMLMAAARLNLPCIFISGGPMLAGKICRDGHVIAADVSDVYETIGKVIKGEVSEAELSEMERCACPGAGGCSGMTTANTMNCMAEALGLALPGNGTIPAVDSRRVQLAYQTGEQIMKVLKNDIKARDIITKETLYNAFVVDMAIGGSTNAIIHLKAMAHEAGVDFPLSRLNEINQRVPNICKLSPGSDLHAEDLDLAGGIPAVMKEISSLLHLGTPTVLGEPLGSIIGQAEVRDREVIRPMSNPHSNTGGISILFGNLAPDGAVVRSAVAEAEMLVYQGPAKVFNSEEEALEGIMKGQYKQGDIIVIRNEGPKGGPGMREMLFITALLHGLGAKVALVTDGRLSGSTQGAAIAHVSPEAAERGPVAALKDGDIIKINIPEYKLDVALGQEEIEERLAALPPFEAKVKSGYLKRYSQEVTSASIGAVLS
ncbi:MAG: dihydroxy-acid dehydratase [Phycisphaerales bacterium]|jgi:dihydroxy-acid dehydratase